MVTAGTYDGMAEEPVVGLRSRRPRHPLAAYAATITTCLVIVAVGAYIGYAVSEHEPIGVFVGAAIALVVLGIAGMAMNLVVRRRPLPAPAPPTDAVLGQGHRTGQRDPDAT